MAASLPATQKGVALAGKRAKLIELSNPVQPPAPGEVLIRVHWAASTPLDLHRADGGLLVPSYPHLLGGGGAAGTVVALGPPGGDLKGLRVGDRVASFAFRGGPEANYQPYITIPAFLASRVPDAIPLPAAATVPSNLVTVFHAATRDLGLELPWPLPQGWKPAEADAPVLVWGAASSVGLFALQVLRHWGYGRVLAVASARHHEGLRRLGAAACFDYTRAGVVDEILGHVGDVAGPGVPYILDCIGSVGGTLEPLSRIARRGSKVAVMLPVIVRDATEDEEPEYEMDVSRVLVGKWAEGVIVRGVRTHFYLENDFFKEKLQPELIPALLASGAVEPNAQRVVEGAILLERAQTALDLLRSRAVSGERLVWRVADD